MDLPAGEDRVFLWVCLVPSCRHCTVNWKWALVISCDTTQDTALTKLLAGKDLAQETVFMKIGIQQVS